MNRADRRYTEAFAHDVAAVLTAHAPKRTHRPTISVQFDVEGNTWAVRYELDRRLRFELLMPRPGAIFALFRNRHWHGGIGLRLGQATPAEVAAKMLSAMREGL